MKKSLFIMLMIALILASCSEKNEEPIKSKNQLTFFSGTEMSIWDIEYENGIVSKIRGFHVIRENNKIVMFKSADPSGYDIEFSDYVDGIPTKIRWLDADLLVNFQRDLLVKNGRIVKISATRIGSPWHHFVSNITYDSKGAVIGLSGSHVGDYEIIPDGMVNPLNSDMAIMLATIVSSGRGTLLSLAYLGTQNPKRISKGPNDYENDIRIGYEYNDLSLPVTSTEGTYGYN